MTAAVFKGCAFRFNLAIVDLHGSNVNLAGITGTVFVVGTFGYFTVDIERWIGRIPVNGILRHAA
jgi:hypothetical protein